MKKPDPPSSRGENISSEGSEKALTCIRPEYTLATTFSGEEELNGLMIRQFLDTLTEVALSVASRGIPKKEGSGD